MEASSRDGESGSANTWLRLFTPPLRLEQHPAFLHYLLRSSQLSVDDWVQPLKESIFKFHVYVYVCVCVHIYEHLHSGVCMCACYMHIHVCVHMECGCRCVCVYSCECQVCMCIVHTDACTEAGQKWVSCIFPSHSLPCLLRQGLSWTWSLQIPLNRIDRELQGSI